MTAIPSIYDAGLDRNAANHAALTPLSFIARTVSVYPDYLAVVHGDRRLTWRETYARMCRIGSALNKRGIGKGDTVSIIAANTPEMFESHFAVPMSGAVLNTINTRLEAETIGFILSHAESKVVMVDPEFAEVVDRAIKISGRDMLVIDLEDAMYDGPVHKIGSMTYDDLLAEGDEDFDWQMPTDEWDAISLNYTSGTTGNPKGVVYHHRGAALNAMGNILTWGMPNHSRYLWTLPMFHCNGWCFPWTIAAMAGVCVCLRAVRVEPIFQLIRDEKVTHFCGAPIVLNMLASAPAELKDFTHEVKVMTAAAPPPASVIAKMEAMGVQVTHAYGLTECYGPSVSCAWKEEWNEETPNDQAKLKSRQGVRYHVLDGLMVADAETMEPTPKDGKTIGEIFMRGNIVMKGYLKNPTATAEAFRGGWFATGDLAVMHPDGYLEIKDRSKDIIISGGENISSIEIEDVLYRHPAVSEAAVVAKPDEKWGETPCAFVDLRAGATVTAEELIAFCRENMAHFKAPKTLIFGPLPKTSTGKVQKYVLRNRAAQEG